jgi:hypothetical protein
MQFYHARSGWGRVDDGGFLVDEYVTSGETARFSIIQFFLSYFCHFLIKRTSF